MRLEKELRRLRPGRGTAKGLPAAFADAVERAAELGGGRVSDPEAAIGALGVLLDQAITAQERPEPVHGTGGRKSPDPSVSSVPADDAIADYMPQNFDLDLMAEFINESTDLIQNAEEALLSLEHDPGDAEAVGKASVPFTPSRAPRAFSSSA